MKRKTATPSHLLYLSLCCLLFLPHTHAKDSKENTWDQITATLTISSFIFVLLNLIFELSRRDLFFGEVYDRKREWREHRTPPPLLKRRRVGWRGWGCFAVLEWLFLGWDERYQNFAGFMAKWEAERSRNKEENANGCSNDMLEGVGDKKRCSLIEEKSEEDLDEEGFHDSTEEEAKEEEGEFIHAPAPPPQDSNSVTSLASLQNKKKEEQLPVQKADPTDDCIQNEESLHTVHLNDSDRSEQSASSEKKQKAKPPPTPKRRYYLSVRPGTKLRSSERLKQLCVALFRDLLHRSDSDDDDDGIENNDHRDNGKKEIGSTEHHKNTSKKDSRTTTNSSSTSTPASGYRHSTTSTSKTATLSPIEQKLLRYAGLDSYLMIRFTRFGFDVTFWAFLVACFTLIPVYYTNDPETSSSSAYDLSGYFRFTVNRLEESSLKLWVVWLYAFYFYTMVLIRWYGEWRVFEILRKEFLTNGDFDAWVEDDEESLRQFRNSCLVEFIPRKLRHNKDIYEFYNQLFPGHVKRAEILYNTTKLSELINRRDKMLAKYESIEAKQIYEKRVYSRKMLQHNDDANWFHRLFRRNRQLCGCLWCCFGKMPSEPHPKQIRVEGKTVNALDHYSEQIADLNHATKLEYERILHAVQNSKSVVEDSESSWMKEQQKLMDEAKKNGEDEKIAIERVNDSFRRTDAWHTKSNTHKVLDVLFAQDELKFGKDANSPTCNSAFVEFTDKSTKQSAIQCNLTGRANWMVTKAAPDPRDIMWNNVTVKIPIIKSRKASIEIMLLFGVLFWGVLVAALTDVFNPTTSKVDPIPQNDTMWDSFVRGYVPVLILSIILLILPVIFRLLGAAVIRFKSASEVDKFMFKWNVLYRLAQFFTILISGTIFDTLENLKDNPGEELESLVNGILRQSQFFFNVVINAIGLETMAQLSQLPRFLFTLIVKYIVTVEAASDRSIEWLREPQFFRFGRFSPPFFYCFLIALVYSAIVPLVLGVCAVYFYIATKVYTHQVLYVFLQPYEGGGKFMYSFNRLVFVAMYSSILILTTVLSLKKSPEASISFFVLMGLFTIAVQIKIGKEFVDTSRTLPLTSARVIDKACEDTINEEPEIINSPVSDIEAQCNSSITLHSEKNESTKGLRLRKSCGDSNRSLKKHKSGMGIGQPVLTIGVSDAAADDDTSMCSDLQALDYYIYRQPVMNVKNWKTRPRSYRGDSAIYGNSSKLSA